MTDLVPVRRRIEDTPERVRRELADLHARGLLASDLRTLTVRRAPGARHVVDVTVLEAKPKVTLRTRLARFDARHPILSPCLKALGFGLVILLLPIGALVGLFILGTHTRVGGDVVSTLKMVGGGLLVAAVLIAVLSSKGGGKGGHSGKGWHYTDCK